MVLEYMVLHGSHQEIPSFFKHIYQHHGSVMGYNCISIAWKPYYYIIIQLLKYMVHYIVHLVNGYYMVHLLYGNHNIIVTHCMVQVDQPMLAASVEQFYEAGETEKSRTPRQTDVGFKTRKILGKPSKILGKHTENIRKLWDITIFTR